MCKCKICVVRIYAEKCQNGQYSIFLKLHMASLLYQILI